MEFSLGILFSRRLCCALFSFSFLIPARSFYLFFSFPILTSADSHASFHTPPPVEFTLGIHETVQKTVQTLDKSVYTVYITDTQLTEVYT